MTLGLLDPRSNQLSYTSIFLKVQDISKMKLYLCKVNCEKGLTFWVWVIVIIQVL